MQAFGWPDERVVHLCLMDRLIGSALTLESRGRRNGLIEKKREDGGRDCDINTVSARVTKSV